jgi:hypothetical protein
VDATQLRERMNAGIPDANVLELGQRGGSYLALALFASMFAVLGYGVYRESFRRAFCGRQTAAVLGALLFAGPTVLVYGSSLNGFYEAEIRSDLLVLRYLHPISTQVRLVDIASIRSAPAFRGRWRLSIVDLRGNEYVSATWHRDAVEAAAARLQRHTSPQ